MSKPKRDLTADENKLWRAVAKTVKPRRTSADDPRDVDEAPPPKPARTLAHSRVATAPAKKAKPVSPPANRAGEKNVRRGKLEIGGKLDLHGYNQDSAEHAIGRFLRAAHARGDRAVVVITGVGRGGEGVLKRRFTDWVGAPGLRAVVAGYAPAHRVHGGAGAFYVFLKRSH